MIVKSFPVPCRIDYVPSPLEPDEDGVMDVGYQIGKLSDGRKYRLECWRMDDMIMLTVMFSDIGIESYKRADMYLLLECEDILKFKGSKRPLQVAKTTDDVNKSMWSLNLMLANSKQVYADLLIDLTKYNKI